MPVVALLVKHVDAASTRGYLFAEGGFASLKEIAFPFGFSICGEKGTKRIRAVVQGITASGKLIYQDLILY